MATVEQILNSRLPKPTMAMQPGRNAPIPNQGTFTRPDQDDPDPTGRTLDPVSGKYVAKSADTPRIYGKEQSLLIEGQAINHVPHSTNLNNWSGGANISNTVTSIIDKKDAYVYSLSSGQNPYQSCGTFSGGTEAAYAIFEEKDNPKSGVNVFDIDRGLKVAVSFDWSADTTQVDSSAWTIEDYGYELQEPINGNRIVLVWMRYSGQTQGNTRRMYLQGEKNGTDAIFHHAQLEERPNKTIPFVTGSSTATRGKDQLDLDLSDDFSPNAGTFYMEFEILMRKQSFNPPLLRGPNGENYFRLIGFNPPYEARLGDGAGNTIDIGGVDVRTTHKWAATFDDSIMRAALNGNTGSGTHDGSLVEPTSFNTGYADNWLLKDLRYIPELLPENPSASTDKVSIETLTKQPIATV